MAEYGRCVAQARLTLEEARYVTLMSDGWTDRNGRSIIANVAVTEDRKPVLLGVEDCSASEHTGEYMAGKFRWPGGHIQSEFLLAFFDYGCMF